MTNNQIKKILDKNKITYKKNFLLKKITTWKIGGPAEFLIETDSSKNLIRVSKIAYKDNIPLTILGGGSNVLISDNGIKGIVVRNLSQEIEFSKKFLKNVKKNQIKPRLTQIEKEKYYDFNSLEYFENKYPRIEVKLASGVILSRAINILISKGVTGLQWFAGIPGTIGGAVYNNIHGGSHFISEYVNSVIILNKKQELLKLNNSQLKFGYDSSIFHNKKSVIIYVNLLLYKGNKDQAMKTSIEWAKRKQIQPKNSAGSCFQNLTLNEQKKLGFDSNSFGYIIDKKLKLKGLKIGNSHISNKHAGFIETTNQSKSEEVLMLLNKIYSECIKKFNIKPQLEIELLGFTNNELDKYFPSRNR